MTHSVACTYKWIGKKGGTEFHEIGVWLYCLYTSPVVIYGRGLRDSEMLLLEFRELALADTHTHVLAWCYKKICTRYIPEGVWNHMN